MWLINLESGLDEQLASALHGAEGAGVGTISDVNVPADDSIIDDFQAEEKKEELTTIAGLAAMIVGERQERLSDKKKNMAFQEKTIAFMEQTDATLEDLGKMLRKIYKRMDGPAQHLIKHSKGPK